MNINKRKKTVFNFNAKQKSEQTIKIMRELVDLYQQGKIKNVKTVENIVNKLDDNRSKLKALTNYHVLINKIKPNKVFLVSGDVVTREKYRNKQLNKKGTWSQVYTETHSVSHEIQAKTSEEAVAKFKVIVENSPDFNLGNFESASPEDDDTVSGKASKVESVNVTHTEDVSSKQGISPLHIPNFSSSFLEYEGIPNDLSKLQNISNTGNCVADSFLSLYPHIKRHRFISSCIRYGSYRGIYMLDEVYTEEQLEQAVVEQGITPDTICKICKEYNISCYGFDIMGDNFVKSVSNSRNYKAFVFYSINRHLYLVLDCKRVKSLIERAKPSECRVRSDYLKETEEKKDKYNPFSDMSKIKEDIQVSDLVNYKDITIVYNKMNLNSELTGILQIYKYIPDPKTMKYKGYNLVQMTFNYNDCNLVLSADLNIDINYETVHKHCEKAEIEFTNQTFPALVKQARERFYQVHRVKFSKQEREALFKKSPICNECGDDLDFKTFHIDHITPLAEGGSNDEENLQCLCKLCHFEKTKQELEDGYIKASETKSTFNNSMLEVLNSQSALMYSFVESLHPRDEEIPAGYCKTLYSFDICRSRMNAILNNKFAYPLFTVMDDVKRYDGVKKTGIYFVETASYFPLRGNGWYPLNLIEFCLRKNIITEENIKYYSASSLEVKPDYFNDFIKYCNDVFGDDAKLAINSMIGSFKPRPRKQTKLLGLSEYNKEVFYHHVKHEDTEIGTMKTDDKLFYLLFKAYYKMENETEVMIYNQVLAQEIINLYELFELIRSKGGYVLDLKTDAVSCVFKSEELPFKIKEQDGKQYIDEHFWEQTGEYKYKLENKGRLKVNQMFQWKRKEQHVMYRPEWNVTPDPQTNDFNELVDNMISSNKSYFVEGRGGTGKSTLINLMKEKLKDKNISFQTLAPTNKAANIIDGKTIHRFIKTASKLKEKELEYIFVDEISMVKEIFYSYFLFLKRLKKNVKFIIAGDFNQLLPVKDRARYDYENSVAFHELVDSNKVALAKCRRANDEFFNLTAPENVMKLTGKEFGKKLTDRNICHTNDKRKQINRQLMDKYARLRRKDNYAVREVKALAYDKNSQDMILYKGLPVIARMNNRKLNLINNDEFYVERVGGKDVKLVNQFNKQFSIIVELKMFNRLFYPAYAITVHKAQGSTYTTSFTIHQFDIMDRRLRYVSLSRASQLELVNCF